MGQELDTLTPTCQTEPSVLPDEVQEATSHSILIVDDDPTLRKIIQVILKRYGYQVVLAENGCQAIECVKDRKFDLILLDWMMPEMDGLETCRALRQNSALDDTPIIFITAKDASSDKALGFSVGGSDYITKPVNAVELIARVKRHLEQAQKRRQLRKQAQELEGVISNQTLRLDQVRSGQEKLLVHPSDFPEIKVAVRFLPAQEAGGDFYDIVRLGEDCYGFMVADVAGHDLSSAYLTGALKALTVSFTNEALTTGETMMMLNNSLNKFFEPEQYATASYVKFSKSDMTIEIASAGHPNPLIQRVQGRVFYLDMAGDVLGMFDTVECQKQTVKMEPGDKLFLFSDGLLESWPTPTGDPSTRDQGAKKLADRVANKNQTPLSYVVNTIVDELVDLCDGHVGDDVVLMGIEF